jgi:septum formation topological specificity factor MinE
MTLNFPLLMDDHAEKSLEELDNEIVKVTQRLVRLHNDRMRLMAHTVMHHAFDAGEVSDG